MADVLIHHTGLKRTVAVPAEVAPAWLADDGWILAPKSRQAEYVPGIAADEADAIAAAAEQAAVDAVTDTKENKS